MCSRIIAALTILTLILMPIRTSAAELVMFESEICEWCQVWHQEIGGVYAKTPEGRKARLRRIDIDDPRPADLQFVRGIRFTPTFVLVDKGVEIGRIAGYPGEDFFWGMLDQILKRLDNIKPPSHAGAGARVAAALQ